MQGIPNLDDVLVRLERSLSESKVRYALIGGAAVILRGYRRATEDIDAVVWDADERLPALLFKFAEHGLTLREPEGEQFARRYRVILLRAPDGTEADVSMGALPFELEVIERAEVESITESISMPVASAEDLIVMKLVAFRDQDLDDVRRLLELYPELDKTRIRRIVTEYAEVLDQPEIVDTMTKLLKRQPR